MSDEGIEGLEGLGELRTRLQNLRVRMTPASAQLTAALRRAGEIALMAAANRIRVGGPGWVPNKTHTPLLYRTGALFASLFGGDSHNILRVSGDEVEAGTSIAYARYLQEGTRFMPAREFLYIDDNVAHDIQDVFAEGLLLAA